MKRTLLIVDDISPNRKILKAALSTEYTVLEASQGEEALAILNDLHASISAVLLDIVMPEMDGYEVLKIIRSTPAISQIPVIMITGFEDEGARSKCLSLGANDYVMKPYNPDVIRHCLRNNIALREAAAAVNTLQRDKLTGLHSRETFFEKVGQMVQTHEPGYYVMACFDIDRFKVINDQYGTQKGDEVLRYIATVFRDGFEAHGGLVCRVAADDFAVLYPAHLRDSEEVSRMREKASAVNSLVSPPDV